MRRTTNQASASPRGTDYYDQGQKAYHRDEQLSHCPYRHDSPAGIAWYRGFYAAADKCRPDEAAV